MNSFQNNILESTRNLKTGKVFIAWLTAGFFNVTSRSWHDILWLTFNAIDVSFKMTLTWFIYGILQAFAAGVVFAKLNP